MAICVVVGTRPGIVKMSPIIREVLRRGQDLILIHTGQHFSFEMDRKFFEDLQLPTPDYRLDAGGEGKLHGEQTAAMLLGTERALIDSQPDTVLVCGDANTNLAGALAARKLHLTLGHVEAGLRSRDWRMPEEHNRVMIDHISDLLFAPTEEAKENLLAENVQGRIVVTGNTAVDALEQNYALAQRSSDIVARLGLVERAYVLVTIHREENVDVRERVERVVAALSLLADEVPHPVVFPVHPRTTLRFRQFGLDEEVRRHPTLRLIDPVGYFDFLRLLGDAAAVVTDSGGVQEESCVLRVPCVTVRESTERPESVKVAANRVAGLNGENIVRHTTEALTGNRGWPNPFGDGRAAERIVHIVMEHRERPRAPLHPVSIA